LSKSIQLHFELPGNDLNLAGEASSKVKKTLNQLGLKPAVVKKTAVAMYEAEINAIIHAGGGTLTATIDQESIVVVVRDQGPGIADLELAMQEGYSTASEKIRKMGFGAGMGLPNMKRHADLLEIESAVGQGTLVTITVFL